jgi:hypothetical protein
MYKFTVNQTKIEVFQVVFWHLLVERFQETFDDQISEISRHVDWAFAIAIAPLLSFLLRTPALPGQTPFLEKAFLFLLFISIAFGLIAKFWPVRYRFSKPTDTPVRRRLTEMISPALEEGFFKDLTFEQRRSASFDVSVNLSIAVGLGKKVPKKILKGADESVEALKSLLWSLKWKQLAYFLQLACAFSSIAGFVLLLIIGQI